MFETPVCALTNQKSVVFNMVLAYTDYTVGTIVGLSVAFGILFTKLPNSKPAFLFTLLALNFMLGGYRYGKTKMVVAFLANLFCVSFDYFWHHFGMACSITSMNMYLDVKGRIMKQIYQQWPYLKKLTGASGGSNSMGMGGPPGPPGGGFSGGMTFGRSSIMRPVNFVLQSPSWFRGVSGSTEI